MLSRVFMIAGDQASSSDIYEAVLALSRCIAGRNELESLLSGISESLRRIVGFEYVALILHDAGRNEMRSHVLNARGATPVRGLCLPFDQDPAGWVWMNQQPLVIPSLGAEDHWPAFWEHARAAQVCSLTLVPLTAGENRLGAFGFGSASPYQPTASEVAFLERVASEFAVAVEVYLAKRALVHERDRLQTLFEITNALVSKLSPDELSSAIAEQLSRVVRYDFAVLSLCNEQTGGQDLHAIHFNGPQRIEILEPHIDTTGMPAGEALATGKPVVVQDPDFDRFASPSIAAWSSWDFIPVCSIPLLTPNGAIGTLEIARTRSDSWTSDDVEFLVQVANQIAIALQNSLSYRELHEMKERLATEKLYLEDEIRLDNNIGIW